MCVEAGSRESIVADIITEIRALAISSSTQTIKYVAVTVALYIEPCSPVTAVGKGGIHSVVLGSATVTAALNTATTVSLGIHRIPDWEDIAAMQNVQKRLEGVCMRASVRPHLVEGASETSTYVLQTSPAGDLSVPVRVVRGRTIRIKNANVHLHGRILNRVSREHALGCSRVRNKRYMQPLAYSNS